MGFRWFTNRPSLEALCKQTQFLRYSSEYAHARLGLRFGLPPPGFVATLVSPHAWPSSSQNCTIYYHASSFPITFFTVRADFLAKLTIKWVPYDEKAVVLFFKKGRPQDHEKSIFCLPKKISEEKNPPNTVFSIFNLFFTIFYKFLSPEPF